MFSHKELSAQFLQLEIHISKVIIESEKVLRMKESRVTKAENEKCYQRMRTGLMGGSNYLGKMQSKIIALCFGLVQVC